MAEALLAGAAVGAAFGELLKVVIDVGKKIVMFKSELKLLQSTLISIQPMFDKIEKMNTVLNRPKGETEMFVDRLRAGTDLVLKCKGIPSWNYIERYFYAKKMIELDKSLLRFFQMDVQAQVACDTRKTLVETSELRAEISDIRDKLNRMLSIMKNGSGGEVRSSSGFAGCCGVPGLPDLIVGLDKPLRDLKEMLLRDGVSEVLISAPGGSGKTTLAQVLCHDTEIKGKFGEILFVTVSKKADLQGIVRKIFEHKSIQKHEFQSDEDAIRQLEQLMKLLVQENGSILLVLDDVWSTWESLIDCFRFQIPGYNILVTSRFEFRRFDSRCELNSLNDKDADALFRHSAFPRDGNFNIPDYLVKEIVEGCKGVLDLIVVGRSLYGQDEVKWRSLLKKCSKGQYIFDKDEELLLCLKNSLDDLDEMAIIKECFLDLGAFPEDETIQSTILMDMWAELYNLEYEDMETLGNLLELSFRSLINLVPISRYAARMDGYYDDYVITQHDLLRELAIRQSSLEPIERRERLIIDISGNNLPDWWIEQRHQIIHARLLSIFTDKKFSSWYDMQVPEVEVLILNFRPTENYTLPHFMERMDQLKVLILKCCQSSTVPDLSLFPVGGYLSSLRRIRLENVSISSLGTSLMQMRNLRKMSFIGCKIVKVFEKRTSKIPHHMLPNLVEVVLEYCLNIVELFDVLCNIDVNLKKLSVRYSTMDALPEGIGRMTNLEVLRLSWCIDLEELPEWIGNLHKLRLLDISFCPFITRMPERMGELCALKTLYMGGCKGLTALPASVKDLRDLEYVICDEKIAHQWEFHNTRLTKLKISTLDELFHESTPEDKYTP